MAWVLGIIGAVFGAGFGAASGATLGFFSGALLGALLGQLITLRQRVHKLESALEGIAARDAPGARSAGAQAPRPVVASAAAAPPEPAHAPAPATEPATDRAPVRGEEATDEFPALAAARATPGPGERATYTVGIDPRATAVDSTAAAVAASVASARSVAAEEAEPPVDHPSHGFARMLRGWFTEGNVPVKLGVLVLFVGVAAALKYAVDQGLVSFPIELRVALIALGGVAGLWLGWRERGRRPAFALAIQGGAIGVLLLTVFAAFRLYHLLPAGFAFSLFVLLVAGAALLAILQDAIALAVLGIVGGFLAPVLISTGSGNHVALFSYYALLNAAVLWIAWIRPWRILNLIGFAFTFGIGTLWGAKYYRPELFGSVEPFLVLYFLFYVAISVLYALRQPPDRRGLVDGTLTFGTPLLAFPLQAALLKDDRMGLAYSALAVAALYALLAWWLLRRERRVDLLGRSFAALSIGFATLAVPLALSARWTATTWAAEGAALVWLGLRQRQWLPQLTGAMLQLLAAVAFVAFAIDHGITAQAGEMPVLNAFALGALVISLSGFFISWLHDREDSQALAWIAFLWAWAWWTLAGMRELIEHFDEQPEWIALAGLVATSSAIAALLRGLIPWPKLGWPVVLGCVLGIPLALAASDAPAGPLAGTGLAAWAGFLVAHAFGLQRLRDPHSRGLGVAHVAVLWTVALVGGMQLERWTDGTLGLGSGWVYAAALAPLVVLTLGLGRLPRVFAVPVATEFEQHRALWSWSAGIVLAALWMLAHLDAGDTDPVAFIPLLNPLELLQLGLLVLALRWSLGGAERQVPVAAMGAAGFLLLTVMTLRAVHQLTGAPWSEALFDSRLAQTALTVVWSIAGVAAWIAGSRMLRRGLWLAGAILMGVVLAKLVLVDRSYVGNIAGIVSFVAVGLLLIVVGYVAPSPPRRAQEATA